METIGKITKIMSKYILFTLVSLNVISSASQEASIDAFLADLADNSNMSFLEDVFGGGTFHRMHTEFLMRIPREESEEDEHSERALRPKQEDLPEKNPIVSQSAASIEEEKEEAQYKPSTLSHAVSAAEIVQKEKLSDDWDVVEGADEVDCTWPKDAGVENTLKNNQKEVKND